MTTDATNPVTMRLVEAAAFALFGSAQKLERCRFFANVAFFGAAIVSMLATGYVLYVTAIAGFLAGAAAFVLRLLANRRKALGHSLHRVSMLARAYRVGDHGFDVAYLLSRIPSSVHRVAVEAAKSQDPAGDYASPTDDTGATRLRWMVQENAFFNASMYDACADRVLQVVSVPAALLSLFMLLALPIVGGEIAYVVLRVVLAILSVAILYDLIDRWASWRAASRAMLDLENELARFTSVPDHRVLLLFSDYQVAICGTPAVQPSIYRQNREKLNAGWAQRVAALRKEWSDGR